MHGLTKWVSGLMRNEQPKTPRLNTVIQMYQRLATSDPDTVKKNVRVFKLFIEQFGNIHAGDVTKLMVAQFQASLKESGKSVATLRSYGGSLSSVFGWAVENGTVRTNPCRGVKLPKLPKCDPTFWTRDEMIRLHEAIDRLPWRDEVRALQWHALIQVADDCGLRIAEILNLRWMDIELDSKDGPSMIHIRHRDASDGQWWQWGSKGRRDRSVLLAQASLTLLRRMEIACPWLYPFLPEKRCLSLQARARQLPDGVRKRPYTGLYIIWNRIKTRANVKGDGAFHRMRRTAATELAEHLNVFQLQQMFGWQVPATAEHYVAIRKKAQHEAVAKAQAARTAGGET